MQKIVVVSNIYRTRDLSEYLEQGWIVVDSISTKDGVHYIIDDREIKKEKQIITNILSIDGR